MLTAKKYADEAYPAFRQAYPSRACPLDLYELGPWMNAKTPTDPWGTPFTMVCSNAAIVVGSAGEDARFGTSDDIWSNQ